MKASFTLADESLCDLGQTPGENEPERFQVALRYRSRVITGVH
jgi:hypothetical protein